MVMRPLSPSLDAHRSKARGVWSANAVDSAFELFRIQERWVKRQLSLPVSMMSQWWVRRSSRAVVIFGSPNTDGHSPKGKFVVMAIEVTS